MMKNVLIISPHFPPVNAADMHRLRQGLPYFRELGWEPIIITVSEEFIESYSTDSLLLKSIPQNIEIHKVKAFPVKFTRKLALGSLSMRAYLQIKRQGNKLLKSRKFDLIYFTTTAFHVMALGPVWERKFGIPFVLDIQDPWRNDYYLGKPKSERPPKFLISYNIDKYLEKITVPFASGIISVSQGYINTFLDRYPEINPAKCVVIPFGAAERDFDIMMQYIHHSELVLPSGKINFLYIGRGGHDMQHSLEIIFTAFKRGLQKHPALFEKIHLTFIGTSYAPKGMGIKTILPIAKKLNVDKYITEITDRIPYFEALFLLKKADALLVPGSTDITYTASKIYPYLLAKKQLLAVFNENSSVVDFLEEMDIKGLVKFGGLDTFEEAITKCFYELEYIVKNRSNDFQFDRDVFERYTAFERTKEQIIFFERVLKDYSRLS